MAQKSDNKLELGFKVERSNELNTLRPTGMNLTEVRFLAIYQAKINARKPETRTVTFSLAEFAKIMEIKELNIQHIKNVADRIICKPVHIPSTSGTNGFTAIPLFNECEVYQDNATGEWKVKIECHQKALPYMFEMKRNYFTYELWNALKLKSVNQLRMYEILKQYEKIGERTITLDELKNMLGINKGSQAKYQDFRREVLEVCQKALEQHTDIKYTFEPIRRGRKIHALKFTITRNKNFKDDLRLKEFIKPEDLEDIKDVETVDKAVESLYYRCNEAYTMEQLKIMIDYIENSGVKINIGLDNYIYSVYANIKFNGNKVNNLFKYTLGVIKKQLDEHIYAPPEQKEEHKEEPKEEKRTKESNDSFEEWKEIVRTYPRRMSNEECFYVLDDFDNTIGFVFECNFDKISNGTWRELDYRFKNGHLSQKSDLGRSLISLKK